MLLGAPLASRLSDTLKKRLGVVIAQELQRFERRVLALGNRRLELRHLGTLAGQLLFLAGQLLLTTVQGRRDGSLGLRDLLFVRLVGLGLRSGLSFRALLTLNLPECAL